MRDIILKAINDSQGIKNVELSLKVLSIILPLEFNTDEFHEELSYLVEEGEILEIEYTLPSMDYRIKSFYLPKGTSIHITKG